MKFMQKHYNNSVKIRAYASSAQGGRKYMEDEYSIVHYKCPSQSGDSSPTGIDGGENVLQRPFMFFGIFDGHGGEMAARYSRDNLCRNIVRQKEFWSNDHKLVCLAIHRGFVRTQRNMLNEVGKWPKTTSGLPSTAGSTASVVFIMNGHYYTGHVGDSRIVLGRADKHTDRWIACPMTRDHKPESVREKRRIEAAGGKVMNKAGVGRVVWNRPRPSLNPNASLNTEMYDQIPFLAVARSLGDLWSLNKSNDIFIVSPEPDVHCIPIDPADRCLILASDGLWNMMNNQNAVKVIQDFEQTHKPYQLPAIGEIQQSHASQLLDVCMNRWNRSRYRADNTTVLTIMLDTACEDIESADSEDESEVEEEEEEEEESEDNSADSEVTDSDDETDMSQNVPPPASSITPFGGYFGDNGYTVYDYLQDYYNYDDFALDDVPEDDDISNPQYKDRLQFIGDTIHSLNFSSINGIDDEEAEHEAQVSSVLSDVLDQVSSELKHLTFAMNEDCDYDHTADLVSSLPLRTTTILSKSTLSALHHFNELSDDKLCEIAFDQWPSSYIQTDYLQNNFSTVLNVDRAMLGFKDYLSSCFVKSCYSSSKQRKQSVDSCNFPIQTTATNNKVVFHESQNILVEPEYRPQFESATNKDQLDQSIYAPPMVQAGLDPVIIINSPPVSYSSEISEEEEDSYRITTLESNHHSTYHHSSATHHSQYHLTKLSQYKRTYDYASDESGDFTPDHNNSSAASFPITMMSGHHYPSHHHHKRFRSSLDSEDDANDAFIALAKTNLLDMKHQVPLTAATNE